MMEYFERKQEFESKERDKEKVNGNGHGKVCYIQTVVGNRNNRHGEKLLKDELWWKIVETQDYEEKGFNMKRVLLRFESEKDMIKFKRTYCKGYRQLPLGSFGVRFSPWKDVPKIFMNTNEIYISQ